MKHSRAQSGEKQGRGEEAAIKKVATLNCALCTERHYDKYIL